MSMEYKFRELRRFGFGGKSQHLATLYQRLELFFVKTNTASLRYWMPMIKEQFPELAAEMCETIEELQNLTLLKKELGMVPKLNVPRKDVLLDTLQRVRSDELRFQDCAESWGITQNLRLMRIVTEQSASVPDWVLDESAFDSIVSAMNTDTNAWSRRKIRTVLCELGIDYHGQL